MAQQQKEQTLLAEIDRLKRALDIECNAKNEAYYFILSNGLISDFKAFCSWAKRIDVKDPVQWLQQAAKQGNRLIKGEQSAAKRVRTAVAAAKAEMKATRAKIAAEEKERKEREKMKMRETEQDNTCMVIPLNNIFC